MARKESYPNLSRKRVASVMNARDTRDASQLPHLGTFDRAVLWILNNRQDRRALLFHIARLGAVIRPCVQRNELGQEIGQSDTCYVGPLDGGVSYVGQDTYDGMEYAAYEVYGYPEAIEALWGLTFVAYAHRVSSARVPQFAYGAGGKKVKARSKPAYSRGARGDDGTWKGEYDREQRIPDGMQVRDAEPEQGKARGQYSENGVPLTRHAMQYHFYSTPTAVMTVG